MVRNTARRLIKLKSRTHQQPLARYTGRLAAASMLLVVSAGAPVAHFRSQTVGTVVRASDACLNQAMAVVGEVRSVFGPRLFAVAAPDTGIDVLVFVPGSRVAAVRAGMPVCIAGTITLTPAVNLELAWGSFERDPSPALAYPSTLMVEQATSRGVDVVVSAAAHATWPDTAATPGRLLTDVGMLANATDTKLVGRFVSLLDVRITTVVSPAGFWVASDHEELFVLPADEIHPQPGQRVNVKGVVLQVPNGMINKLGDYGAALDEAIYVYASQFRTL